MAYTRSWSGTTPQDTDQASTLGAVTRNLRLDIHERMDTLLDSHWTDDPVGGFPITKVRFIPPQAGYASQGVWLLEADNQGVWVEPPATGSFTTFAVPVMVPIGCTLTKVRIAAKVNTAAASSAIQLDGVYQSTLIGGMTPTLLGAAVASPTADSAWHWLDATVPDTLIGSGDVVVAYIKGKQPILVTCGFAGIEVTYTCPNLLTAF